MGLTARGSVKEAQYRYRPRVGGAAGPQFEVCSQDVKGIMDPRLDPSDSRARRRTMDPDQNHAVAVESTWPRRISYSQLCQAV